MNTIENNVGQICSSTLEYVSLPKSRRLISKDISNLGPKELIEQNIRTERDESINIERIYLDPSLIDQSHAQELGNSMKGERGQLSRILVRAKIEEGKIHYDILDGFHRTLGKINEGYKEIDARVIYGCSDQEMYDIRILSVNSVKSIQFARLAQWMTSSFKASGFSEHMDVCQAFGLTVSDSNRSNIANDLNPQQIEEIKQWCGEKSKLWEKPLGAIYQDLRIISMSNPNLVKIVKDAKNGNERAKYLTKEKLRQIVEMFPGEKNYNLQQLIVDYLVRNRLGVTEVKTVLSNLEYKNLNNLTNKDVLKIIKDIKFETPEKKPRVKRNKIDKKQSNIELDSVKSELKQALEDNSQLKNKITDLKKTIENNISLKENINYLSSWINNTEYPLSKNEKIIISLFLYSPQTNIFKIVKDSDLYSRIESSILSAINKKINFDDDNRYSKIKK